MTHQTAKTALIDLGNQARKIRELAGKLADAADVVDYETARDMAAALSQYTADFPALFRRMLAENGADERPRPQTGDGAGARRESTSC